MKLFTKEVDKQLFAQYPKGSDLDNQMVVAKIFNPYGRGVWYLLNSDPEDPDYIWAIVDLFEPDMGSVSRSELQTVKVPPFGLGLERDIYFTPKPAKEVWEGIMRGERFAHGGMTAGRYYKDNSGNEFRFIGESEGKLLFKDGEKIITKSHEDFEDAPKEKKLFGIFADGGETAAAEHNIKQAKYGAKLVGKQKNLDVNKNGKLDAEDFKMLRGEKMANGGEVKVGDVYDRQGFGKLKITKIDDGKFRKVYFKYDDNDKEFFEGMYGAEGKIANKEWVKVNHKMAMGGKIKFEDKVKSVKESLLKRKKVSPKVQKDYGKTYDRKEALEAAKRIVGARTAKYELKKKFKEGGKTIAQTPAPKKDRVFGSSKNKAGSASSKKTASNIELNESIVKTLGEKAKNYNEKHSSKVSTSTLKAVMRRGMGAFSTSHRPGMSRQGWGFARVNKFLLKKGGTKVKAAYVQDDDLL